MHILIVHFIFQPFGLSSSSDQEYVYRKLEYFLRIFLCKFLITMPEITETPELLQTIDPSHEFYVHHGDLPNLVLSSTKLNGDNYSSWKTSCEVSLTARNKLGFTNGKSDKPDSTSHLMPYWERCNSLVISWLLHSVETEISNSVLYCTTAKDIWNALSLR